ncbi:MAG: sigma-70 family RNA polymerase sigma factor [Melioribacteraceae bacterium]|jgi:RNA polymerase sigma factor for flagellar operon FliA|nr:sigma-70 family RNA polymerase sigma factor [Melioribacteraceae bacterium]
METTALWTQYKQDPTEVLKKQLLLCYTNLVHYVIHHSKFVNLNIFDSRDYFQFGIEGLSEAVERFDPQYGTKFETYAIQRIRGKIIDELRKAQIKPRFSLFDEPGDPYFSNVSMDRSFGVDDGNSLHDLIPSETQQPEEIAEKNEIKDRLLESIKGLNERDRLIITLYYFESLNYREISEVLDITVSRISQIHSRILESLKEKLEEVDV